MAKDFEGYVLPLTATDSFRRVGDLGSGTILRTKRSTPTSVNTVVIDNMPCTEDERSSASQSHFCIYLGIVALARLYLVHDIEIPMINAPHDGSLYASRAFYLVTQWNFGPFDGRLFVKDLGASVAMAFARWLGLSYVSFLNLFHLGVAVYFALGMVRIGLNRVVSGVIFAVALFAPITFSGVWFDNTRENLDTILHFWFFSALTFGLVSWQNKPAPVDLLFLAISGAGAFFVREDALLLLSVPAFLVLIEIAYVLKDKRSWALLQDKLGWSYLSPRRNWPVRASAAVLLAIVVVKIGLMSVIYERYGLLTTATNDFNSGAFPRFVAALRSASGEPTRPYVSITREGMRKVSEQLPYLKAVVERMTPSPSPDSHLAQRFGVTDETTNSHIFFWIKDAAFRAGYTPNAKEAKEFFQRAAIDIENACAAKLLTCTSTSRSLLPPVRWSWLDNIWGGIGFGLVHSASARFYGVASGSDGLLIHAEAAGLAEAFRLGRMYEFIAKTTFDAQRQGEIFSEGAPQDARSGSVGYWCRYFDIAAHKDFGTAGSLSAVFYRHFSQSLGLAENAVDWSQLSDQKNRARIDAFLSEHPPKNCWEPGRDPILAAVLSYLQQENGKLDGLTKSRSTGALRHFLEHGQLEGRVWIVGKPESDAAAPASGRWMVVYRPVTIKIRQFIYDTFLEMGTYVCALAFLSLLLTLKWWKENLLLEPMGVLLMYIATKIIILAYISITVGLVDVRVYMSNHYILLLFALLFSAYNLTLRIRQVVLRNSFQRRP